MCPMRSLSVGARHNDNSGETFANGNFIVPLESTNSSILKARFFGDFSDVTRLRDGSANWLHPTSEAGGAHAVVLFRKKVKVINLSPRPSGFINSGDLTVIFLLLRGPIFGSETLPLFVSSPSHVIDQKISKSDRSEKNCLLKTKNSPVLAV